MLTPNALFLSHIAEEQLKIAEIYDITLQNGEEYNYTSHSKDIDWNSKTYIAIQGVQRSQISYKMNLSADDVTISLGNISGSLFDKLMSNAVDAADVVIKRIIWDETYAADMELMLFQGTADLEFNRQILILHCRSILDSLNIQVPKNLYQEECNNRLFDTLCTLIQADYALAGAVTSDGDGITLIDSTRGTLKKVAFDGGDSSLPVEVGDAVDNAGGPGDNDFSGDVNCVALWSLDDGAVTVDSKGTNTLTNNNTVTNDVGDYKEGDASGVFNGTNEYLDITDANLDADFPLKNGDANKIISVCFWCKPDTGPINGGYDWIFTKYDSGGNKRSIALTLYNDGGTLKFRLIQGHTAGTDFEVVTFTGGSPTLGRWFHIGFTYNDADKSYRIRIWDDTAGALLGADETGNCSNAINIEDAPVMIGNRVDGGYLFDGHIDEVVVFKDVLTADEIDEIRNGTYGDAPGTAYATIIHIVYTDETSGFVWFNKETGTFADDDGMTNAGGDTIVVNGTPAEDVTFYALGEIAFTSGLNDGYRRMVLSVSESTLYMAVAFPNAILTGDTYNIYPGCDKNAQTCVDKFGNEENYKGDLYLGSIEEIIM